MPIRAVIPGVVGIVAAAAIGRAHADDLLEPPRARQGYYIAVGGHGAVSYNVEDGDGLGPWSGFSTSVRLGQLLTRRLGAGLAIDAGGASGGDDSAALFGLGLAGQIVLVGNLAAHASVGLGVVSVTGADDDEELRGAVGAAYTLGLTYDWFPGSRRSGGFAVTPGVSMRAVPGEDFAAFVGFFGVELSYWTGLPRHQLQLAPGEGY